MSSPVTPRRRSKRGRTEDPGSPSSETSAATTRMYICTLRIVESIDCRGSDFFTCASRVLYSKFLLWDSHFKSQRVPGLIKL